MKYFRKIEGERVYLSPINKDDVNIYTKWMNDSSVTDGIGRTSYLFNIDGEKEYLEKKVSNEYKFAIVEKSSDTLIGNCSIFKIDNICGHGELGIMIGEESFRSKGYGQEAIRLLLSYCFETLNFVSVELSALSFNERAINCYKKCGFKEVGRLRKSFFANGSYHDSVILDILKEEFYEKQVCID